ncbi:MAG TPA: hypothetical protein VKC60_05170 [Opitutaceae bacterium]|nr:hypothetical protein [Opitutaceae bacterium]
MKTLKTIAIISAAVLLLGAFGYEGLVSRPSFEVLFSYGAVLAIAGIALNDYRVQLRRLLSK